MVINLDEETEETSPGKPQVTRRRVQLEGVQVFERFYFHPELLGFINESLEVRYDARDSSRVSVVLPDFRVIEAETISVIKNDNEFVENAFELLQLKGINRLLVGALWQALEIRGIYAALLDPLALEGEKVKLRGRLLEIDSQIRAAIKKGDAH